MSFPLRLAPVLAVMLGAAACGGAPPSPPSAPTVAPLDGLFDVGGLTLHLRCEGSGAPVVVLDAGLGDDASVWNDVLPAASRETRVCAYDRAGTGTSSAAPRPHGSALMVGEQHALLGAARIPGPYVLVGHSLGGLNVRLFASAYPEEVAGVVLIDATTEEQDTRYWSLLPEDVMAGFRESLQQNPEGLDYEAFVGSLAEVRRATTSLGDRPLVVLTHGKEAPPPPGVSAELASRMATTWADLQSPLARLSSRGAQVVVRSSGHYIHGEAPALVVAAIDVVVSAVRERGPLDARKLAALAESGAR